MATRTITTLVDDKDGSEATESLYFAYAGVEYRIDLSDRNAAAFRKDLEKRTRFASRIGQVRTPVKPASQAAPPARGKSAEIREWAGANGWPVSPRGRIPANVIEAFGRASG